MRLLTRVLTGTVLLGAVLLIPAVPKASDQEPPASTSTPEPSPTSAPAATPAPSPAQETRGKPLVIPPAEKSRKNPVPAVAEAIESGRTLFQSQCGMCHGPRGEGKGDLAQSLKLKIPDFTDPRVQGRRTDGELFYILTNGHGEMPPEKRLADQQKWEMILYIRTLARAVVAGP